jgi:hypothetical protein
MNYRVAVDGVHKHTGKRCMMEFIAVAESGDAAIDKIFEDFDLSGIDVNQSVAAEQADMTACVGIREII